MNYFVDTNVFLRFLTKDEEKQYQACYGLFQKAKQGKIKLTTSSIVVFELIWTLISYYEEPKEDMIEKISSLLEFPNLTIEEKETFLEALFFGNIQILILMIHLMLFGQKEIK